VGSTEVSRIVDAIPGLAWSCDPDGNFDYFNQRWCEYSGMSMADACKGGWRDAIHPDDFEQVFQWGRERRRTGQAGEVEARLRRSDGEFRWFVISTEPQREDTGTRVRWFGQQSDIDDRKRAEAILAGQNRLLEMVAGGRSLTVVLEELCALFEDTARGCHCSVSLLDPTGTRFQVCAGVSIPASFRVPGRLVGTGEQGPCALAAYTKQQVISADVATETRWQVAWCPLALAHGLRACWSTPISSKGGRVIGTFAVYLDEPGAPTPFHQDLIAQFTHIAGIANDRAQNEAALRRSEAFLAEAQYLSSTGSFSWKVTTDEVSWSEEVYRIYGFREIVPVTMKLALSRTHPEDIAQVSELMDRARRERRDFQFEYRLQFRDASVKYLHVVGRATPSEEGQLEYIGAIQDVTERRRSEEALGKVRSELAHVTRVTSLGALTASIAHEVNQPLAGIITNANTCLRMLAAEPPNIEGAFETARRTIRDGNRASDVIVRLRQLFAKTDGSTDSVDLNEATREVIALSQSELQRGGVILRTNLADDLPAVIGDRVQLQQVILNLLLNASDAMIGIDCRPRQLLVTTGRDGDDWVRLSVRDLGVGINPEEINKLFDAFYTTKSTGMGIGLSVSRSIIESHRGHLWAASNDGPGATFSFSLPAAGTGSR
jgi:PAS domain S-box-containing protein